MVRQRRISRRAWLKAMGVTVGASALAACQKATPTPTPQPTATPAPTAAPTATPLPTPPPMTAGATPNAERFLAYAFQEVADPAHRNQWPVSFRYDNIPSAAALRTWQAEVSTPKTTDGVTRQSITLTDPKTGLQCRCEVSTFTGHPAVEWVAYFKNTGAADTPLIEDIRPLDVLLPVAKDQACQVHHARGSQSAPTDFMPIDDALAVDNAVQFATSGGRSSEGALPFFNVEAAGGGVVGAIGWTGNWEARFARQALGVQMRAGMQRTALKLHPGEEIRTPRIALLFYQGERIKGQNLLRRFILAQHTPRPNGQLLQVPISDAVWGERRSVDTLAKAQWIADNKLPIEYFWIDAGWLGNGTFNPNADTFGSEWAVQVGNWFPNTTTYPKGLKEIGDAVQKLGMGFVLWFEPERAYKGTQFTREHPEWLLGPQDNSYVFNLGIPEARRYLTDLISKVIEDGGVTCYRQDFNISPYNLWKAADAADRVGMTEIRHIEGLYAYWDELLARHPGLIIDNCSSGGRRIDLETISRSVPLWRSDVQCSNDFNPTTQAVQTAGLGMWVPLSTGCCRTPDTYAFRSALGPGIVLDWCTRAVETKVDFPAKLPLARKLLDELLAVRPCFYGDFYPLTPITVAESRWQVMQFDRPDLGTGMVLALRRSTAGDTEFKFPLQGLDAAATYEVRSLDTGATTKATGKDLAAQGLTIAIADMPGSALITYKRI